MNILEVIPLNYENWELHEPGLSKLRDCANFGSRDSNTPFKWRASRCDASPSEFSIICQYG